MNKTPYGQTGLDVSVVGFGGMRFDTSRSDEENADLVRYACEQGINYFDTAPGYCGDRSEDIFGEAFKHMPGDFFVSTKGMPTSFDTADKAYEAVCRSLERLHVACIDFYHVWCLRKMAHYELAVQPGGQLDGLRRARQEGLIKHIVCSTHQPGKDVERILSKDEFEGVLLGVNILNFPYRWDGLVAAKERACGVVAMNPLAGGAIPRHEEEFAFLATGDETATDAALRFVIGCPLIDIALVGFTTTAHVDQACRAAEQAQPLSAAEITRLRGVLGENLNEMCTACGYCRGCPEHIPVASYMQFYNNKVLFGKSDEEMRKSIGGELAWGILVGCEVGAGACTECGRCEEACTQHLPIISRLKEIAVWEAGHSRPA